VVAINFARPACSRGGGGGGGGGGRREPGLRLIRSSAGPMFVGMTKCSGVQRGVSHARALAREMRAHSSALLIFRKSSDVSVRHRSVFDDVSRFERAVFCRVARSHPAIGAIQVASVASVGIGQNAPIKVASLKLAATRTRSSDRLRLDEWSLISTGRRVALTHDA
jgi:hypothetical protein